MTPSLKPSLNDQKKDFDIQWFIFKKSSGYSIVFFIYKK